jgi:dnd system-associated protein 4
MSQNNSDSPLADPGLKYARTESIASLVSVDKYNIFGAYRDLIVFLGVLGYREGEYVEEGLSGFDGNTERIKYSTFTKVSMYRDILGGLAFQHTSDPDTLVDKRKQLDVLDGYAGGGLRVFRREFDDIKGNPTDAVVNFIQSYEKSDKPVETELQTILDAFNQDDRLG